MSLLDIRLLEESINESIDTPSTVVDNLSNDTDNGTPNIEIENPKQSEVISDNPINLDRVVSNIEELEDKINNHDYNIDESIAESIMMVDRTLINAVSTLESISIDAINKQYKILQETSVGTDLYESEMTALVEASGENIFKVIIDAIKKFIEHAKMFLAKLGINISINFVDYEKWANSKYDMLISLAKEKGNKTVIDNFNKYNKDILFEEVNFRNIQSILDDFVPHTTNKDKMEEIISNIGSKYDSDKELSADVYAHALGMAVKSDDDEKKDEKIIDKSIAEKAFKAKYIKGEKSLILDEDKVREFLDILKSAKSKTSKIITTMKSSLINPEFETLKKEIDRQMLKNEEDGKTTKYHYYRLRFTAASSIQTACNDIYRFKLSILRNYYRDIYNALKKLDTKDENDSTNESVDLNSIIDDDNMPALVLQS